MSALSKIRRFIGFEKPKFEFHYAAPSLRIFIDHTNEVIRVRNTMSPTDIQKLAQQQIMKQYENKLIHTITA